MLNDGVESVLLMVRIACHINEAQQKKVAYEKGRGQL